MAWTAFPGSLCKWGLIVGWLGRRYLGIGQVWKHPVENHWFAVLPWQDHREYWHYGFGLYRGSPSAFYRLIPWCFSCNYQGAFSAPRFAAQGSPLALIFVSRRFSSRSSLFGLGLWRNLLVVGRAVRRSQICVRTNRSWCHGIRSCWTQHSNAISLPRLRKSGEFYLSFLDTPILNLILRPLSTFHSSIFHLSLRLTTRRRVSAIWILPKAIHYSDHCNQGSQTCA